MDLAGLGHDGVSEDGLRRSHESGTEFSKDNGHLSQVPRSQESESNHFQKAISAWRSKWSPWYLESHVLVLTLYLKVLTWAI